MCRPILRDLSPQVNRGHAGSAGTPLLPWTSAPPLPCVAGQAFRELPPSIPRVAAQHSARCRPGVPCVAAKAFRAVGQALGPARTASSGTELFLARNAWSGTLGTPRREPQLTLRRAARFLTRGGLQTIQGSIGKPFQEAVVCRRCLRGQGRVIARGKLRLSCGVQPTHCPGVILGPVKKNRKGMLV